MSGDGKGWANPGPAGLIGLAIAGFTFYALLSGSVGPGALPLMGCWLLGGALVQLVVGIVELKEGSLLGGNVFLFFSGFFMLTGAIEMFVKYFAAANRWAIPLDAHIDGYAWLVLTIAIAFLAPCYMKASSAVMGLLVLIITVAAAFVAGVDIGWLPKAPYQSMAAYILLIVGVLGLYQACAIFVNSTFGRNILPTGGPLIK